MLFADDFYGFVAFDAYDVDAWCREKVARKGRGEGSGKDRLSESVEDFEAATLSAIDGELVACGVDNDGLRGVVDALRIG